MKQMSLPWIVLTAGAALLTRGAEAQDDWTRNFRVGMQLGVGIRADFKTSGQFALTGNDPGAPNVPGVNHNYDDGYVRVDETGNAMGYTSYWGYNDKASQYDATAPYVTFHSANSVNVASATSSGREDAPYIGFDMAYGGTFGRLLGARLGWELGFGLLPISITDTRPLAGTFTGTVHQFLNRGDIVMPGATPGSPYQGGSSGIGPVIDGTAIPKADVVSSGTLTGSRTLDVNLFTLRLGPTFYWNLHPRWGVSASAGGAIGLVAGDYRFDEMATFGSGTTRNSGRFGKTDLTYGGYVNGLALFHLQHDADLFAGVQFMPLSDVRFNKGGREAKLDLGSGFYFTAGINWPF